MSLAGGKLDRALDDIVASSRTVRGGRGGRGGRARNDRRGGAAPVDGVTKPTTRKSRGKGRSTQAAAGPAGIQPKLLVSGLPDDVNRDSLQKYFRDAKVGSAKNIVLNYDSNQQFNRSATVIFHNTNQTTRAVQELNGVRIDNRTIKVEMVMDAAAVLAMTQTQPVQNQVATSAGKKAMPKPKPASDKKSAREGNAPRGNKRKDRRGGGAPRPAKKTIEELDQEMEDWASKVTPGAADKAGQANNTDGDVDMGAEEML